MYRHELQKQKAQVVHTVGIAPKKLQQQLVMYGIHGGGDFVTGIVVHDKLYQRLPNELVDALTFRVMAEIEGNVPSKVKRDRQGRPIGHYIYDGLPADHCNIYQ